MLKKFQIITILLLFAIVTNMQALPPFWYSGTAYNSSGQIIISPNTVDVFVKISDGINIFTETHNLVNVSPFGMFEVNVGSVASGLSSITMKPNTTILVQVRLGSGPWVTVVGQSLVTFTASSYVAPGSIILGSTGVSAGTYGNSTNVAQFTVGADGRISSASNVAIAFPTEIDGSTTNELNSSMSWDNSTNTLGVVDAGGTKSVTITGFLETETDPVFALSPASGITAGNITNWNTAFGWGNHATAGYLTTYTETDPIWIAAEPSYGNLGQAETITANWINTANPWSDNEVADNLTIDGGTIVNSNISNSTLSNVNITSGTANFTSLTIGGNPLSASETDPIWVAAEPSYGNLGQTETITANWVNTANPWADNEVADNLTIDGGTITNTNITPGTGTITANAIAGGTYGIDISGNAATATTANAVANALTIGTGLSGTAATYNGSAAVTVSLPNVGTAGTYGSTTQVPVFTTDAQGRVSAVINTAIAFPAEVDGSVTNELNSSMSWDNTTNTLGVVDAGGTQSVVITGFLETEADPIAGAVNGIIKSNGSAVFSAAVAGTDYLAPSAIGVSVQGFDADLTGLSALNSTTTANQLVASSGTANGYSLLPAPTTNGEVLTFNGATFTWTIPASVSESDPQVSSTTTNRIPKWNGTALVDGIISDNGTTAGVTGNLSVSNSLSFLESVGATYYSSFTAGDQSQDINYTLPTNTPLAGQVLRANSTTPTNLEWGNPFTGGNFQLSYHSYNVTGTFTLDNIYDIVELDGSPATFTVNMPAAVLGKLIFIYNNTSVNASILGNPLQKQTGTILFCDGTNWHRMF